jgi:hypothetical protein
MTAVHLIDQLEGFYWSDDAAAMFTRLSSLSKDDEGGAVVLLAAAVLLAREFPEPTAADQDGLLGLAEEFRDLLFEVRDRLRLSLRRPPLRIVGGQDTEFSHSSSQKER